MTMEVLDRAKSTAVPALAGPGITVIDATTGSVTFEYKTPALMLAEAQLQLQEATDLVPLIDSDSMYEEAGTLLQTIVGAWKSLDEMRLSTTKPLREKVDTINSDFAPAINVRKQAEAALKSGMTGYFDRKEAERQRLQREQERLAAEERRRAQAEAAERERQAQAEARRQREVAESEARDRKAAADLEAQRLRDEAAALQAQGNTAGAQELQAQADDTIDTVETSNQSLMFAAEEQVANTLQTAANDAENLRMGAEMTTASAVASTRPKVSGIGAMKRYAAEVVDPKAFIAYALANWETMNHLISIETGKLSTMAQNQKEMFNIPGCKLVAETKLSSRRK